MTSAGFGTLPNAFHPTAPIGWPPPGPGNPKAAPTMVLPVSGFGLDQQPPKLALASGGQPNPTSVPVAAASRPVVLGTVPLINAFPAVVAQHNRNAHTAHPGDTLGGPSFGGQGNYASGTPRT